MDMKQNVLCNERECTDPQDALLQIQKDVMDASDLMRNYQVRVCREFCIPIACSGHSFVVSDVASFGLLYCAFGGSRSR